MNTVSDDRIDAQLAWITRNLETLEQGRRVLCELDRAIYARRRPELETASIGEHVRHCLDFYRCFLRGLPEGRVDYDAREREGRLETDPEPALEAVDEVCSRLRRLPPQAGSDVWVKLDVPAGGAGAWSRSTVARELQFLASHTVHHFTVIAIILRLAGIEVDSTFGVAPSTLAHRQEHESGAS